MVVYLSVVWMLACSLRSEADRSGVRNVQLPDHLFHKIASLLEGVQQSDLNIIYFNARSVCSSNGKVIATGQEYFS